MSPPGWNRPPCDNFTRGYPDRPPSRRVARVLCDRDGLLLTRVRARSGADSAGQALTPTELAVFQVDVARIEGRAGIGARGMGCNQRVDLKPIFDPTQPCFDGWCCRRHDQTPGWAQWVESAALSRASEPALLTRAAPPTSN
jgi:hypothetical protein